MTLRFKELVDTDFLQSLFDTFHAATGIASAILSLEGRVLVGSGWQRICSDFHRQHPEAKRLCIQSGTIGHDDLVARCGESVCHCPHGLLEAAIPIKVDHERIANLLIGQFLYEPPDKATLDRFKKQASRYGFDENAYLDALAEVPVVPETRMQPFLEYLEHLSGLVGEIGSSRLMVQRTEKDVLKAHSQIKKEVDRRGEETRKLEQIVMGNPIPTFVVDADCKVTHWNPACELLTGTPAKDVVGTRRHRALFYGRDRKMLVDLIVRDLGEDQICKQYEDRCKLSKLGKGAYQGESFCPLVGKNGKWLLFTGAPLNDFQGRLTGGIETLQDITEQRITAHELRASEKRYRQLFDSANDAIFLLEEGVIVDCNQKTLDLFGSSREEMLGLSPLEFSPDLQPDGKSTKDEVHRRMRRTRESVSQLFEWRFVRRDGSVFDAEVSLARMHLSDSPPGALAVLRDISDQKAMVQALEDQKAELDRKSRYLEKVNQALKASLDHREVETRAVEEHLLINLKRSVIPYLEELEQSSIQGEAAAYIRILKTNVNDIVSKSSRSVFAKYMDFTPTEVRVADLIRDKKNTKEIASLLGLSPNSVKWHRGNIREKLGLTHAKVNLYTYLNSLDK